MCYIGELLEEMNVKTMNNSLNGGKVGMEQYLPN